MGRILAIDYGLKRVGLAVTDVLQIVPNALATVHTKDLTEYLTDYISKENVERIIIGKPIQMNGIDSQIVPHIQEFVNKIKNTFQNIPIEYTDERFTSVLAHKTIIESGINKKARKDKNLVDKIAAVIILQSYLEYRNK